MSQLKIVPRLSIRHQARIAVAQDRAARNGSLRLSETQLRRDNEVTICETINGELTVDHYFDWRKQFSWQNVLNCKLAVNLEGAARIARDAGYRFVAFEGQIYFVSCRKRDLVEHTGLTTDDIQERLS